MHSLWRARNPDHPRSVAAQNNNQHRGSFLIERDPKNPRWDGLGHAPCQFRVVGRRPLWWAFQAGLPRGGQLQRRAHWQGVEHCVTVRADDFEYLGRPYKSLSSVAREITGTKWNGWVFFGLKTLAGPEMTVRPLAPAARVADRPCRSRGTLAAGPQVDHPQASLRRLHAQIQRRRPGHGLQLAGCPARVLRSLRRQPAGRGLGPGSRTVTTMAAFREARLSALP